MDYESAKQLLFHHVNILTNIDRANDLKYSQFLGRDTLNKGERDRRLVYSGFLKVIDPLTKSVILCLTDGIDITNNILILGQNICDIIFAPVNTTTVESHSDLSPLNIERIIERDTQAKLANHPYFTRSESTNSLTGEHLADIQTSIIDWFTKYMIPIELNKQTQELIVAESVRIRAPYEHESDYISPTRVALKRIKYFVDTRPK